jgi:acylphosphatase
VVFEGESIKAEAMQEWCRTGTPPARVDHLDAEEESPTGEFTDFKIVY